MRDLELDRALVVAMIERANHLEEILVTSLLGLLLTTTFGTGAAIYTAKKERAFWHDLDQRWFLLGIALIYASVSGYYYHMLVHFYAAVQSAFALIEPLSTRQSIAPILSLFSFPEWFGTAKTRSTAYLMLAPLFPLGFSCTAITVFWLALRPRGKKRRGAFAAWIVSLAMQLFTAYLLVAYPFKAFVNAIGPYSSPHVATSAERDPARR